MAERNPYQLLVVAFSGENRAKDALVQLHTLAEQHALELKDVATVQRDADGDYQVFDAADRHFHIPRPVAIGAGFVTSLVTLALGLPDFNVPVANRLAAEGAANQANIDFDLGFGTDFLNNFGERLAPGSSGIVALVRYEDATAHRRALAELGDGDILVHDVTEEQFNQIKAATRRDE